MHLSGETRGRPRERYQDNRSRPARYSGIGRRALVASRGGSRTPPG